MRQTSSVSAFSRYFSSFFNEPIATDTHPSRTRSAESFSSSLARTKKDTLPDVKVQSVLAKYFAKIAKFSVINEALKSGIPTKPEHESPASSGPWERGRLPQRKKEKEGITQRRLPGISPKPPSGYRNEQESLATTPLDGSMTNWPGPYCPVAYKYSMRFNI